MEITGVSYDTLVQVLEYFAPHLMTYFAFAVGTACGLGAGYGFVKGWR